MEIAEREKLYVKYKKNPTEYNFALYKHFKNRNLSHQRSAERNYYENSLTSIIKTWVKLLK